MKLALTIQRLCDKANAPELRDAIAHKKPLPDRCMIWTGAHAPAQHIAQTVRGVKFIVWVQARARTHFQGKQAYVQRVLHQLIDEPTEPFTSSQACTTSLCVNPKHWVFAPTTPAPPKPKDLGPPEEEPWTLSEAIDLVEMYLTNNPYPPVDPNHNILMDVPPDLLSQAFIQLGKAHFL